MYILAIVLLMASVGGPVARNHGGDGGGEDPRRNARIPAQCDEPDIIIITKICDAI